MDLIEETPDLKEVTTDEEEFRHWEGIEEDWDERKNRDQSAGAIVGRLNQKFFGAIDGARIFVVEPPAIPGYGIGSGFE